MERCDIGKYAREMGWAQTKRPSLNESALQVFVEKYNGELKQAAKEKRTPKKNGNSKTRATFIVRKSRQDGARVELVSSVVKITTTKASIKPNLEFNLD